MNLGAVYTAYTAYVSGAHTADQATAAQEMTPAWSIAGPIRTEVVPNTRMLALNTPVERATKFIKEIHHILSAGVQGERYNVLHVKASILALARDEASDDISYKVYESVWV